MNYEDTNARRVLFGVLITRAFLTAESGLAQQPSAGLGAALDTLAQALAREDIRAVRAAVTAEREALATAFRQHRGDMKRLRPLIEAYLLANLDDDSLAAKMGVTAEATHWCHLAFYDVADQLCAPAYVRFHLVTMNTDVLPASFANHDSIVDPAFWIPKMADSLGFGLWTTWQVLLLESEGRKETIRHSANRKGLHELPKKEKRSPKERG